eukprot:1838638-Pyramimonas_sp.AAC.2
MSSTAAALKSPAADWKIISLPHAAAPAVPPERDLSPGSRSSSDSRRPTWTNRARPLRNIRKRSHRGRRHNDRQRTNWSLLTNYVGSANIWGENRIRQW